MGRPTCFYTGSIPREAPAKTATKTQPSYWSGFKVSAYRQRTQLVFTCYLPETVLCVVYLCLSAVWVDLRSSSSAPLRRCSLCVHVSDLFCFRVFCSRVRVRVTCFSLTGSISRDGSRQDRDRDKA